VIHVPLPDKKGRRDLLSFYLGKIKYDPTLDIDNLAAETQGFSGADIQNFVNTAILNAVKEGE
jgi:ATP-dependent metalloprotease